MELILDPVKEVAGALLAAMLVLGVAVGLRYVNAYLKLGVVAKQQQALEAIALEAVQAVAQTTGASVSGPAKKGRALNLLADKTTEAGIRIAAGKAEDLIEAAVHKLKRLL
jgi:LL-H family phage holin